MQYLIDCGQHVRVSAANEADAWRLAGLAAAAPARAIAARAFCWCGEPIPAGGEVVCSDCGRVHCLGCCRMS